MTPEGQESRTKPLRVAVIVKQVPVAEELELGSDGRLVRDRVPLELNAYCRRAITKGVEIAAATGGQCVVFTLGPPAAEAAVREAVAAGADLGVHLCDPEFAGSDTLATARALATAISREKPFDLVLAGLNSVDADTGQVGPEVAELLGLPFVSGVRSLELGDGELTLTSERDDGLAEVVVSIPAVLSVAERLCAPAKFGPDERSVVPASRLSRLPARDLGAGPWGAAGSPTRVGEVRTHEVRRDRRTMAGSLEEQVDEAVGVLEARGALSVIPAATDGEVAAGSVRSVPSSSAPSSGSANEPVVVVLLETGRPSLARELLGAAALVASEIGGSTLAIATESLDAGTIGSWGADRAIVLVSSTTAPVEEEDVARFVADGAAQMNAWAVLAPGTAFGRHTAARAAARMSAGLTGDAIELEVRNGRLVAWKPAFAGRLVAAIEADSDVQMVTVRPGALHLLAPRSAVASISTAEIEPAARVRVLSRTHDEGAAVLSRATTVIGVGSGVPPERYDELERLRELLGAELAATRKVTDNGWLPRNRQVGLTGHSLGPRLYIALGVSGKFNHLVGMRRAETVLAVNIDPDAQVFDGADIGIVGDWAEAVRLLSDAIALRSAALVADS